MVVAFLFKPITSGDDLHFLDFVNKYLKNAYQLVPTMNNFFKPFCASLTSPQYIGEVIEYGWVGVLINGLSFSFYGKNLSSPEFEG